MEKRIIWSRISLNQLNNINKYIFQTSKSKEVTYRVISRIQQSAEILRNNSEIYPLDIYRLYNNGSYRAYEIFHYRISYKISEDKVQILSVRHTSRNPKLY